MAFHPPHQYNSAFLRQWIFQGWEQADDTMGIFFLGQSLWNPPNLKCITETIQWYYTLKKIKKVKMQCNIKE